MVDSLRYSSAPLRQVKAIQLGVLSPDVAKAISVLEADEINKKRIPAGLTQAATYDPLTNRPVFGGLSDERFGDTHDLEDPGQFGHLVLAEPVYHVGFMNTVLLVLRCVGWVGLGRGGRQRALTRAPATTPTGFCARPGARTTGRSARRRRSAGWRGCGRWPRSSRRGTRT
jgi:hypothetical protein